MRNVAFEIRADYNVRDNRRYIREPCADRLEDLGVSVAVEYTIGR